MAYEWVTAGQLMKSIAPLKTLAEDYTRTYCAAKDSSQFVSVNSSNCPSQQSSQRTHDAQNSYRSNHYTNYSKNSPVKTSDLVGNSS